MTTTPHDDLRRIAVEAVANYMHHRLFDEVAAVNMLPWVRERADDLIQGADRAIEKTKQLGKQKGLL